MFSWICKDSSNRRSVSILLLPMIVISSMVTGKSQVCLWSRMEEWLGAKVIFSSSVRNPKALRYSGFKSDMDGTDVRLPTRGLTIFIGNAAERQALGTLPLKWKNDIDVFREKVQIDWYASWPFRSGHDLDLWPNFQNNLLMSNYSSFYAFQQEKDDTGKAKGMTCFSWVKSYYRKADFAKTAIFRFFCSLESK